jgi:hypothetical protein
MMEHPENRAFRLVSEKLLLSGIAALLLATGATQHEARACVDGPSCAVVTKTPDGFLNLRRAPTTRAPVVTILRPGDRLYITTSEGGIRNEICEPSKWQLIEGVWRLDGKPINIQAGAMWQPHRGWAAKRFLRQIKCPKEMQEWT